MQISENLAQIAVKAIIKHYSDTPHTKTDINPFKHVFEASDDWGFVDGDVITENDEQVSIIWLINKNLNEEIPIFPKAYLTFVSTIKTVVKEYMKDLGKSNTRKLKEQERVAIACLIAGDFLDMVVQNADLIFAQETE